LITEISSIKTEFLKPKLTMQRPRYSIIRFIGRNI
jgi:hypothetical protein